MASAALMNSALLQSIVSSYCFRRSSIKACMVDEDNSLALRTHSATDSNVALSEPPNNSTNIVSLV